MDTSASTLQLVTEFFDTQDPVETPVLQDSDYGLVAARFG
jgi:hypothetical protein